MLKTRGHHAPAVNVFITDGGRMGCELMAAVLGRSRNRVAVVGYATSWEESRSSLGARKIDVVVIGAQLKEGIMAGFDMAREVHATYPTTNVIMMLDAVDQKSVIDAFRSGATGIFSRDQSVELLCKCIHAVHQGQIWASSKELRYLANFVVKGPAARAASSRSPRSLTEREQGVVHLVAEGFTNRDISRQLNLSEHTVRNYVFRIFNKVGASSRVELALYALDRRKQDAQEDTTA